MLELELCRFKRRKKEENIVFVKAMEAICLPRLDGIPPDGICLSSKAAQKLFRNKKSIWLSHTLHPRICLTHGKTHILIDKFKLKMNILSNINKLKKK